MRGSTYKKPSEYSATRTLQRFFAKYPEANSITVPQIFDSVERNGPEYVDKNDGWLSNKLTGLYAHSLVKPVYSYNPWRKLEKLELTQRGKTALNREDAPSIEDRENTDTTERKSGGTTVTYQDLAKAVVAFRNDNPDLDITFEVKLKEVQPTK